MIDGFALTFIGGLLNFPGAGIVLTIVGLFLFVWLIFCIALWSSKFPDPEEAAIDLDRVDPEIWRHVKPWWDVIASLGFGQPYISRNVHLEKHILGKIMWRAVHPTTKTVVELKASLLLNKHKPTIKLHFFNFLSDERFLVTAEKGFCEDIPSHWVCMQAAYNSIDTQWQKHLARLYALGPAVKAALPQDPIAALIAEHAAADQASMVSGLIETDPHDGTQRRFCRVRIPWVALKVLKYMLPRGGTNTITRKDVLPPAPAAQSSHVLIPDKPSFARPPAFTSQESHPMREDPVETDLERYKKQVGEKRNLGMLKKFALLMVSMLVFAYFWEDDGRLETIGMIIGILLLHEFGHWLPMKLFGYRDVTMFFVPGFGAAVSGTKKNAYAWQEFIVLLGGPLPGILIGIGIAAYGYFDRSMPDFLLNAATLSIIINALNLLPFLPLDGGRIVELLIFKDIPILRLLFTAFSTLCVLAVSFLPGMTFFRYVAIAMGIGFINDIKMFRIVKEAKKLEWAGQVDDEDTALRRLFSEIRAGGNTTFAGSLNWVPRTQAIVAEAMRKRPSWLLRFSGLAIYGIAALIPVFLIIGLSVFIIGKQASNFLGSSMATQEFSQMMNPQTAVISEQQALPIQNLADTTDELLGEATPENDGYLNDEALRKAAEKLSGESGAAVNALVWADVNVWKRDQVYANDKIKTWLEVIKQRAELAIISGKTSDAILSAETLLHATLKMEPASGYRERTILLDAQISALRLVAKLNGAGALKPEDQQRISTRIQALRTPQDPATEAFVLVEGWSIYEVNQTIKEFGQSSETGKKEDDTTLCKMIYGELDGVLKRGIGDKESASVLIARQWMSDKKAGELPAAAPAGGKVTEAESAFLREYRERKRKIDSLQAAVLWLFSLEDYRRQHAKLPADFKRAIPDAGVVEVLPGPPAVLRLSDARTEQDLTNPTWLGGSPDALQASEDFPFNTTFVPVIQQPAPVEKAEERKAIPEVKKSTKSKRSSN